MATNHHKLDSEKYFTATLLADKKLARLQANETIKKLFVDCTIVILATLAGFYAIKTMPVWLPAAQTWFHQLTSYKYA